MVDLKVLQPVILTSSFGSTELLPVACSCGSANGAGAGGGCKCGTSSGGGA